ncbi:MAG: extracellular solute-binding protein [Chloroflexi bacterium]|nr:extracellular solute-binding protein [Chloroflexota bacterium]
MVNNTKLYLLPLLIVFVLAAGACQEKILPPPVTPPVGETKASPGKSVPEDDWQKTLARAKEEGSLLIYTGASAEARRVLADAFRKTYGMEAEFIAGSPGELETKLAKERSAGLFLGDLVLSGPGSMTASMKPAGLFDPIKPLLVLPEVLDPRAWWGEQGPIFIDTEENYVVAGSYFEAMTVLMNTDVVRPSQLKSYRDLLGTSWKGKIVMGDPAGPGQAAALVQLWGWVMPNLGKNYVRDFVKQEPIIMRDRLLPVEWVARGKNPIGIGVQTSIAGEFMGKGAPIKWARIEEGAWLTGGLSCLSLLNRAPHPNAAKVFANWFLTKEVSTLYSRATLQQASRVDVPTDFLDPETLRLKEVKYHKEGEKEHVLRYAEVYPFVKEVFGPLLK